MESEQFSLCWNNFHNNLSSGFQALLKDEDLVDVTLATEGRYIKAHKTVLSVCSPYLKKLFRANPCKHPIVILHDIHYDALDALLQFMYQGEVSVNQEDIPAFMKAAEVLQVKGLTDGSKPPETSNGLSKTDSDSSYVGHQSVMKRLKPIKKLIKPMHNFKPLEYPNTTPSPPSSPSRTSSPTPPIKQMKLETTKPNYSQIPLIKPKQEPVESTLGNDYYESYDERCENVNPIERVERIVEMDRADHIANQLDNRSMSRVDSANQMGPMNQIDSLNRIDSMNQMDPMNQTDSMDPMDMSQYSGMSNSSGIYKEASDHSLDYKMNKYTSDVSSPGSLLYLKSRKGHPVLIHSGHMYTLSHKVENRSMWVCVKQRTLKCGGCVTTINGQMVISYSGHNHTQLNDVIQRLQAASCSPSPELL